MLKAYWTTKKNEIVTIKRGNKDVGIWKNMYGFNMIRYDTRKVSDSKAWARANPGKYSWTLRILDRLAMESLEESESNQDSNEKVKENGSGANGNDTGLSRQQSAASTASDAVQGKKESFEIQYMDVIVGVVDMEQMPRNELSNAFYLSACGMPFEMMSSLCYLTICNLFFFVAHF